MGQKFEKLKTLLEELFQLDGMIAYLEARLWQRISKQGLFDVRWAVA